MPSKYHAYIQTKIASRLDQNYAERLICFSELALALNNWESVPDLSIYARSEIDMSEEEIQVSIAPLCAVEILSPSQSLQELVDKAKKYFGYGVNSCWLVLPALGNVYVFSGPNDYEIFQANQTLFDPVLGVQIELAGVLKPS